MALLPGGKTKWGSADLVLLLFLAATVLLLMSRIEDGLAYRWNWAAIPQYFFYLDEVTGSFVPNMLIQGLLTTVRLSIWSLLFALPLGIIVGLLRISPHLFQRLVGGSFVALFRNLPPLVLIFIGYFFISDQILPLLELPERVRQLPSSGLSWLRFLLAPVDQLEAFLAAVMTMALLEGAYIAEIVRAGLQAVAKGQWEAGAALGMRRWQILRQIIFPQALRPMVPPLAGQFISTIKDSAIVSVISIQELTFQGMELMAATYLTFEIWICIALLYFLLTFGCSLLARRLESSLAHR
jgi:polar amino acid transport system permease protein